jgi:RND family efflux transporter MFP subunit
MRVLIILAILLSAVAGTVVMFSLREEPPRTERVEPDPLVEVLVLEPVTANFEIHSQGTVLPRTETILSAEVAGTVSSISPKFIPGGVFEKGEVLMRIDPTNYSVAVDQAEALVKQRQIEFDGTSKLRSQGYRAESEYASAAAALASAKAELVRARRNFERTFIRLPYDGMVRAKEADVGQFVSPGTRLGVTFATDFAEVRLPLTDLDLAFVDLPDAADISAAGGANGPDLTLSAIRKGQLQSWPARIIRTEGVVDEKSRVTYAVARVEDPYRLRTDGEILPVGTFVSAVIQGQQADDMIRVPRAAVRGADQLLFVNNEGELEIRSVNIVRADADHVYLSGESGGQRVVLTTLETPVNGMRVRTPDQSAGGDASQSASLGTEVN